MPLALATEMPISRLFGTFVDIETRNITASRQSFLRPLFAWPRFFRQTATHAAMATLGYGLSVLSEETPEAILSLSEFSGLLENRGCRSGRIRGDRD